MLGQGARMNTEIREITQGVYEARNRVLAQIHQQGRAAEANSIVISTLSHAIAHYEYEQGGYRYHYFHVTMHVIGTAIRLRARAPLPAPLSGPLMSINLGASSER
jgi:uncharacterized protein YbjQ (UPF0145 family)